MEAGLRNAPAIPVRSCRHERMRVCSKMCEWVANVAYSVPGTWNVERREGCTPSRGSKESRRQTSGAGRKADMSNQHVECPLMTQSGLQLYRVMLQFNAHCL